MVHRKFNFTVAFSSKWNEIWPWLVHPKWFCTMHYIKINVYWTIDVETEKSRWDKVYAENNRTLDIRSEVQRKQIINIFRGHTPCEYWMTGHNGPCSKLNQYFSSGKCRWNGEMPLYIRHNIHCTAQFAILFHTFILCNLNLKCNWIIMWR